MVFDNSRGCHFFCSRLSTRAEIEPLSVCIEPDIKPLSVRIQIYILDIGLEYFKDSQLTLEQNVIGYICP